MAAVARRSFDSPVLRHAAPVPTPPSPPPSPQPQAQPQVQAQALSQVPEAGPPERRDRSDPCCRLFEVGHTIYKGYYLPSREEYVLHGYPAAEYDGFIARQKAWLDRPTEPSP
jgi:hypothetical protein